ncbi:hypothetical protein [Kitasatospora sp. NPDC059327]|uniref:hypothetical protein n=1 Tax=Kitasatospora sp. NPDC059327 TaxID=3346803 RepID=UPI00367D2782
MSATPDHEEVDALTAAEQRVADACAELAGQATERPAAELRRYGQEIDALRTEAGTSLPIVPDQSPKKTTVTMELNGQEDITRGADQ